MLLRFVVRNFLSIAEELELNLFPYTRIQNMKDHIYETPEVDLLKCAAIYGANGSGKSNLVKAAELLKFFVTENSTTNEGKGPESFRLDKTKRNESSHFEVEFLTEKRYFLYIVKLRSSEVEFEALYQTWPSKGESELLFERSVDNEVQLDSRFTDSTLKKARAQIYTREVLKNTGSLLYTLSKAEGYPEMREAQYWFLYYFQIVKPEHAVHNFITEILDSSSNFFNFSNSLISTFDTGVAKMYLEKQPYEKVFGRDDPALKSLLIGKLNEGAPYVLTRLNDEEVIGRLEENILQIYRVATKHKGSRDTNPTFYPEDESDGTRRIMDFLPIWHELMHNERTVIIDEIGRSLHPNLLEQLVRFFMTSKTKGQLIFTTHEANLLQQDLFRRDEVWLMEKTSKGSSKITPLSDFKVRNDLDVRKGYLNGRFGGVPNLRHLFPEDFATHE